MATTNETGRCWAEINLDNLRYNFTQIRDHVKAIMPEAKVLGVVKADAYGHGAVQAATVLRDAGADFFAVATIGEGVELREAGFTLPILVLGYVGDADAALLAEYDIAAALCDTDTAKAFSAAAQAAEKPIRVHIALNTGMTRIGFETRSTKENVQEILQAISLPGLEAEGAFTHFAVADVNGGEEFTELQYRRFVDMCLELEKHGVNLMYRHCSNSAAILQHTQTFTTDLYREGAFNMVRAGIILYGYYPDADTKKTVPLKPVMTVKWHRCAIFRRGILLATVAHSRRTSRCEWLYLPLVTRMAIRAWQAITFRLSYRTRSCRPSDASVWIWRGQMSREWM